ncbi:L,D-transpeptidase catalytic domain [Hymenobacter gelipurpurascens]|uniref:L,D-transpeptidase catalytic domain n=1 Tax=Hymenobacter gelipurpurascens TaxID=89968 RepID=A0A212TKF4_9BACT|nr:L,D-transpeptidase family protein [Hymenobacter gelipurpurascens]SNC66517.1 L,D-transpeptidase catalytic domain [Hymenobacter gelipurpurascens]
MRSALLLDIRLLCCFTLALTLPRCESGTGAGPNGTAPGIIAADTLRRVQAVPVSSLIRALLDTTTEDRRTPPSLLMGAEVRAFYDSTYTPAWSAPPSDGLTPDAHRALDLLARAQEYGLRPSDYTTPSLLQLQDSLQQPATAPQRAQQLALLDVYLSDAALRFMRDVSRGRLHPYTLSGLEKARKQAWQPAAVLRAAVGQGAVPAAMLAGQPQNREYRQLQQALARWLARAVLPDSAALHQALYEQVALNLERWRWESFLPENEYLLINLPAFELQAVAHDSVLRRHRVIVGRFQTPTPTLSSTIRYFTLAPNWHVPHSIAIKEILPRLQNDASYLERNNYALYNSRGQLQDPYRIRWEQVTAQNFPYSIRQSAGCDNALGNIVFRFANPYSVYLHDTPMRQFFQQPYRALSHGCMRLEHPLQLAAYLLRREGRTEKLPSEEACALQPRPRDVRLRRHSPLYVRYATCTAEKGQLRFLPDIYHQDAALRRRLFGSQDGATR